MSEFQSPREGKVRILVVDDHPVVRQGLVISLSRTQDLSVCGEAANLPEAMAFIRKEEPSIVLSDLDLEGASGIDLIKQIREERPALPVLILSMHDEDIYAERVLRAGARGYLMKSEDPEKVVAGIRAVLAGEIVLSVKMKNKILGNLAGGKGSASPVERLTDRELEVFRFVGDGMTTRQMAEKLSLSVKTIEAHIAHIKSKLGVGTGRELQRHAFKWSSVPGAPPL
jgi:DNA-binding NarL/FixJ family response regulator